MFSSKKAVLTERPANFMSCVRWRYLQREATEDGSFEAVVLDEHVSGRGVAFALAQDPAALDGAELHELPLDLRHDLEVRVRLQLARVQELRQLHDRAHWSAGGTLLQQAYGHATHAHQDRRGGRAGRVRGRPRRLRLARLDRTRPRGRAGGGRAARERLALMLLRSPRLLGVRRALDGDQLSLQLELRGERCVGFRVGLEAAESDPARLERPVSQQVQFFQLSA